jgi:putative transposase
VVAACRAAGVSGSAFYAWTAKREQEQAAEPAQAELVAKIRAIHGESAGTHGSPRVTAELRRRGWRVNHKRVERLMAAHGIVGHRPRRRRSLTKPNAAEPPAPDPVGRPIAPDQPDRVWVNDLTDLQVPGPGGERATTAQDPATDNLRLADGRPLGLPFPPDPPAVGGAARG